MRRILLLSGASLALLATVLTASLLLPRSTVSPTVILVSLDGFRSDYLSMYNPPTLNRLADEGIRAAYLEPIFPTKTFPNHYALATGQYAENHGIVANTMRDSTLGRFSLSNREAVTDGRWWDDAEPIWVTLEKNSIKTAMYFWPGSEAEISGVRPSYYHAFSQDSTWEARVRWVMDALALPPDQRPQLISLYFEHVDTAGHIYGPTSDSVRATVDQVDHYLHALVQQLEVANRLDDVNLIITSDHGMAPISRDSVIFIDDYIDMEAVTITDWDPVLALDATNISVNHLMETLHSVPHVSFYRKEDIPDSLHYRNHPRIRSIIGIADEGWSISSHSYYDRNPYRFDGGTHGYPPSAPSMRGIFLARGPAFKQGLSVDGFSLIHVYELLCAIFDVKPAENDGDLEVVRNLLQ